MLDAGGVPSLRARDREVAAVLRRELDAAAAPFRLLVRALDAPVVLTDASGRIAECNDAFCELVGLAREELEGCDACETLVAPEERDAARARFAQVAKGRAEGDESDLTAVTRTRQRLRLRARTFPLRDATGRVLGLGWILEDLGARKAPEAALRESEERYARVLEGTHDGIWDWDVDGGQTFYSERYWEMLGYGPADAHEEGRSWEARLHPEDKERVLASLRQCIEAGRAFDEEFRLRVRSGAYRWFHARGNARRDARGRPTRMAGAISDVTARKDFEHALQESQRRLRSIVDTAMDAIVTIDHAHRVVLFNRAAERIFGVAAAEVLGGNIDRFLPEALRDGEHRAHMDALAARGSGEPQHGRVASVRALRADGTEFRAQAAVSATRTGSAVLFTVILREEA